MTHLEELEKRASLTRRILRALGELPTTADRLALLDALRRDIAAETPTEDKS